MDELTAQRIAAALESIAEELKGFRADWMAAPMQDINRRMLAQLERAESGVAAPTLVFPGKPGSH